MIVLVPGTFIDTDNTQMHIVANCTQDVIKQYRLRYVKLYVELYEDKLSGPMPTFYCFDDVYIRNSTFLYTIPVS